MPIKTTKPIKLMNSLLYDIYTFKNISFSKFDLRHIASHMVQDLYVLFCFGFFLDAFSLDPNTGLVRSRRLLQSSERFNLTVVATDQGRPPLWGTADLIITVIDVNDNRPVFVRPANGTIIHISEVPQSINQSNFIYLTPFKTNLCHSKCFTF